MATKQSDQAEEKQQSQQSQGEGSGGQDGDAAPQMSAVEAAEQARQQLSQLTGLPADTVSSVTRQDGSWEVSVELVELERLPPSTDVLATYRVSLDERGQLAGYERVQRYLRSQAQ